MAILVKTVGKGVKRRFVSGKGKARSGTLVAKVNALERKMKGFKPETKWAIATATQATFNYAGSISQPLTGISQGTADFNNRIGDSLQLKGIRLDMIFQMQGTAAGQVNRVIVFQYKDNPDGAIGVASYINLLLQSSELSTARAPLAPYDHDNRASFRVLYDKTFAMNYASAPGTSASNNTQMVHKRIHLKLPKAARDVHYFNAGTSITKNELCILVLSDQSTNQYYTYNCAMYYTDA